MPPNPTVSQMVKSFREELELSQQAFAVILDLSIRSVAHYEAGRSPGAVALVRMMELAATRGKDTYREYFRKMLASEFEIRTVSGSMYSTRSALIRLHDIALQLSPDLKGEEIAKIRETILMELRKLSEVIEDELKPIDEDL